LLITRSATTAMIQAMAMLEYRPSTSPRAGTRSSPSA
jgi:hypothetical protein